MKKIADLRGDDPFSARPASFAVWPPTRERRSRRSSNGPSSCLTTQRFPKNSARPFASALARLTPCDFRVRRCPSPLRAVKWPRALRNQKS